VPADIIPRMVVVVQAIPIVWAFGLPVKALCYTPIAVSRSRADVPERTLGLLIRNKFYN